MSQSLDRGFTPTQFAPQNAPTVRRAARVSDSNCGSERREARPLLNKLKVLVADDHRLIVNAIRIALEGTEDIEIVGETSTGAAVLPLIESTQADMVLLDIMMPQMDGLTCLERIGKRFPHVKVIIVSAVDDPAMIKTAFDRGARAFVAKHVDPRDLASVIRQANEGTVYQPLGLRDRKDDGHARLPEDATLTESQLNVLQALTRGLSNKEIARELWLSEQTVKFHLSNIYRALGVGSRAEAIRFAYQHALVENPLFERV
jgi:DNA-binding NarL/FixJ family response regulator